MQNYTTLYKTTQDHAELYKTKQDHAESYRTVQDLAEPYRTEEHRKVQKKGNRSQIFNLLLFSEGVVVQFLSTFSQKNFPGEIIGKLKTKLAKNINKLTKTEMRPKHSVNNNNNLIQSNKKLIMQQITDLTSGSLGSINID